MSGLAIFDLDGTLVDSAAVCAAIATAMLHDRGSVRTITASDALPFVSLGGEPMIAALLGHECGDTAAEIDDFRQRYADADTPANSLFPGVRDGLELLHRQGVTLALCSNKPQSLCEKVLRELGLTGMFDLVVGGRPGLRPKPHPDLLQFTLGFFPGFEGQTCFVGDSELDHAVARGGNLPFIFLTYGYALPGWICPDGWHCDSFAEAASRVLTVLDVQRRLSRPLLPMMTRTAAYR